MLFEINFLINHLFLINLPFLSRTGLLLFLLDIFEIRSLSIYMNNIYVFFPEHSKPTRQCRETFKDSEARLLSTKDRERERER